MSGNNKRCRPSLRFIATGIQVAVSMLALSAVASADELHVLNWKGWGTDLPAALEVFEKETGTKVVHDYISSYPETFTKLHTSPGYYDVIVLNVAFVNQAIDEGLLEAVDVSKLANYKDLVPQMRDVPTLVTDSGVYGVPWIMGATSVTYNTKTFDKAPDSLEVLWDPKYEGRVCWRDNPEDSVRFAALALGQNPDKPEDMDAIGEKLRALKPQIKSFWKSEDEWRKLHVANECDLSIFWTASADKARSDGMDVQYFIPKEGAIAYRDALLIPAGSKQRDNAHKFIDFMTSKQFYKSWVEDGGAPISSNAMAMEVLPADSSARTVLMVPENLDRINFKGRLSNETRQSYLDLWQETKTYYAR